MSTVQSVDIYSTNRFIGARPHFVDKSWADAFPSSVDMLLDEPWAALQTALPTPHASSPHSQEAEAWAPLESTIAAAKIPTVILFTFDASTGCPIGYLVSEEEIEAATCRCLKMFSKQIEVENPHLRGTRRVIPQAHFEVGRINTAALKNFPIRIRAKQTDRQHWLSEVWHVVETSTECQTSGHFGSDEFQSSGAFVDDALTLAARKKLLMLLFAAGWERESTPDSARMADLGQFGVEVAGSRSAFTSTFKRLGIEVQNRPISLP